MSKYIPADTLIAELKFAKSVYSNPNRVIHGIADAFRQDGRAAMCDDILKKIDSLQYEQSKEEAVISDTDKSNLRSAVKIIRASNHPFKENLALTLEKYIKR